MLSDTVSHKASFAFSVGHLAPLYQYHPVMVRLLSAAYLHGCDTCRLKPQNSGIRLPMYHAIAY